MPRKEAKWKSTYKENLILMSNSDLFQEHQENIASANSEWADEDDFFKVQTSEDVLRERLKDWLEN